MSAGDLSGSRLSLPLPEKRFSLHKAVCSYGYFLLAPNHWDIRRQVLHRPLHMRRGSTVRCMLRQVPRGRLIIECDRTLDRGDQLFIKIQVKRMLRYDEDLSPWRKLNKPAARRGFGRMFRSPTLFEDVIKTITSCNVTWPNTMTMNRLMVEHVGHGNFPTPAELADFGVERLKSRCKVGYRAERIVRFAREVLDGHIDLESLDDRHRPSDALYQAFIKIYGLGPYAAANLCHLVGHYNQLPIDTETYRHFCKTQNIKRPKDPAKLHRRIEAYYRQYEPYPFLAYWFELWEDYQRKHGPAWRWDRESTGQSFTATKLNS